MPHKKAQKKDLKRVIRQTKINKSRKSMVRNMEKKLNLFIVSQLPKAETYLSEMESKLFRHAKGNTKQKKRASRKISRLKNRIQKAQIKQN